MKKWTQVFYAAFFLIVIGIAFLKAGESQKQETWVISKAIEAPLEDIKESELAESLKDLGISAKIEPLEDYLKPYTLLTGRYFTLYLAPTYLDQDQVWIMENQGISTPFEELNAEQLSEMEKFRYLMGEAYQHSLGYPGHVMFMDLKKDYGLGHPTVCLEMIPATLTGPERNQFDIQDKIGRTSYFLFEEANLKQLSPENAKLKADQLKNILTELQAKNQTLEAQKRVAKNTLPWSRKITHMQALKEAALEGLKQDLVKRHALFTFEMSDEKPKNSSGDGEFTEEAKESIIEKCAFCNPKVIKNQFVYKAGDFVCLYNFRPYTPGYHFMITPYLPLHVENWQNFSLADALQIDQMAQALVKAIKLESGKDDVILFVQNGMAAGMTVPHGHMHVLLRPSRLHLIAQVLVEISNHKRKGLTSEEMDPVKEKFRKRLEALLPVSNTFPPVSS